MKHFLADDDPRAVGIKASSPQQHPLRMGSEDLTLLVASRPLIHPLAAMKWQIATAAIALGCAFSAHGKSPIAREWCDPELSSITGTDLCWLRYHDLDTDTSWGYIFPTHRSPKDEPITEFIGILSAPASAGWVGNSFGGSPLGLVAWLDGRVPVVSIRPTAANPSRVMPANPTIHLLSQSGLTSSGHQRYVYRCQNCLSWSGDGSGGTISINGTTLFGFAAHTSSKPSNPSSRNTGIPDPNIAGRHFVEIKNARTPSYWTHLAALQGV